MCDLERGKSGTPVHEIFCVPRCFMFVYPVNHCPCTPINRHKKIIRFAVELGQIGNVNVQVSRFIFFELRGFLPFFYRYFIDVLPYKGTVN
jgi:hypothetical protein